VNEYIDNCECNKREYFINKSSTSYAQMKGKRKSRGAIRSYCKSTK